MFFLPLKVDLNLNRWPILTLLICVVCIFVHIQQTSSSRNLMNSFYNFCQAHSSSYNFVLMVEKVQGAKNLDACADIFYELRASRQPADVINDMADNADRIESFPADYSRQFIHKELTEKYQQYTSSYPEKDLTERLMHDPTTFNLKTMVTAAFAHGDWGHLIGNLIFFYAFAASIEVALGYALFTGVFITIAIGSHFVYSLAMMSVPEALPTIGLSGVVMGMIGLFAFLMPLVRIRCLLWFIIIFRIIKTPAWMLAVWYIGWDIYELNNSDDKSNINFIAHVSGAFLGLLLGLIFFRQRKQEIRDELYAS